MSTMTSPFPTRALAAVLSIHYYPVRATGLRPQRDHDGDKLQLGVWDLNSECESAESEGHM